MICYFLNSQALSVTGLDLRTFSRYVAPLLEEGLKAVFLIYLIRSHRIGFLVDAAIHGFAIGAGFAFIENVYYLYALSGSDVLTAVVRGFGTAVMHGGATALFGIVTKALFDRPKHAGLLAVVLPGLAIAYVVHALFNHFLLPPLVSTGLMLTVFPPLIVVVFARSEEATRAWLGVGFDSDQELLQLLKTPDFGGSPIGQYLHALKSRFPGEVIADMFCLLRIRAELSIRAKGIVMMRSAGFEPPEDPTLIAKFEELAFLERSIGRTGLLALDTISRTSTRDLWHRNLLTSR